MEKSILNKANKFLKNVTYNNRNDKFEDINSILKSEINIITILINNFLLSRRLKKTTLIKELEYLIFNLDLSNGDYIDSFIYFESLFRYNNSKLGISTESWEYLIANSKYIFDYEESDLNETFKLIKIDILNNNLLKKCNNNIVIKKNKI